MNVYKYMATKTYNKDGEINLLEKVFENKALRFLSPNDFNDPFEFRYLIEDLNTLINTTFDKNQFHNTRHLILNWNMLIHYVYQLKMIIF